MFTWSIKKNCETVATEFKIEWSLFQPHSAQPLLKYHAITKSCLATTRLLPSRTF